MASAGFHCFSFGRSGARCLGWVDGVSVGFVALPRDLGCPWLVFESFFWVALAVAGLQSMISSWDTQCPVYGGRGSIMSDTGRGWYAWKKSLGEKDFHRRLFSGEGLVEGAGVCVYTLVGLGDDYSAFRNETWHWNESLVDESW